MPWYQDEVMLNWTIVPLFTVWYFRMSSDLCLETCNWPCFLVYQRRQGQSEPPQWRSSWLDQSYCRCLTNSADSLYRSEEEKVCNKVFSEETFWILLHPLMKFWCCDKLSYFYQYCNWILKGNALPKKHNSSLPHFYLPLLNILFHKACLDHKIDKSHQ